MEEKSIFEYIQDNINANGKISADCNINYYLSSILGKDYELNSDNMYCSVGPKKNHIYKFFSKGDEEKKAELELCDTMQKTLEDLDSNRLEKFLDKNEINIRQNIDKIIEVIENNIKGIDKERLSKFCKNNILKTSNVYCMYIYLLLSSYVDIKKDKELENIILKIGLLKEFTLFINYYLLDKFTYPDYSRFYLLKRITTKDSMPRLIDKMSLENDEVKYWILYNYTSKNLDEEILRIVERIDLLKILKKWNIDFKLYDVITNTIYNVLVKRDECDDLKDILIEYMVQYSKLAENVDVLLCAVKIYEYILESDGKFSDDIKDEIIQEFKKMLCTDKTINLIKNFISDPNADEKKTVLLYETISLLNIYELYLKIYNEYKNDPLNNINLINMFKKNLDLYEKSLRLLEKQIDWNEIIGEYTNVDTTPQKYDPVYALIVCSDKCLNFAMSVYSKTLRAKKIMYRRITLFHIDSMLLKHRLEYDQLSDELKESMEYLYKNELGLKEKEYAGNIMGIDDDEEDYDNILKREELRKGLRLVGKNDEEILEEISKEEKEKKNKKVINLKERIVSKLDMDDSFEGLRITNSGKIMYIEEFNNEIHGCCQGDEFGKEYRIILRQDEENNLKEALCTCGKSQKERFCKHVLAVLVYLSKKNDQEKKKNS